MNESGSEAENEAGSERLGMRLGIRGAENEIGSEPV